MENMELSAEVKDIQAKQQALLDKEMAFANKFQQLVNFVQKVDGNVDLIKNSEGLKNLKRQLDALLISNSEILRFGPNGIDEMAIRLARMNLTSEEMAFNSLYERYNPYLDELMGLYKEKAELKEKAKNPELGGKLPTDPLPNNIAGINDVPTFTTPIPNNPVSFMSEMDNSMGINPEFPINNSGEFANVDNNIEDTPSYPVNDSSQFKV